MLLQSSLSKKVAIAAIIAFFMLLTRGSHVLTAVSLPDASLVLFLLGGLLLGRAAWFVVFFILASVIDFGAAAIDSWQAFCLTDGYWGLIPAYGAMWLGGRWLAKRADPFAPIAYANIKNTTNHAARLSNRPPSRNSTRLASGKDTAVSTWLPRVSSMKNAMMAAMMIFFERLD